MIPHKTEKSVMAKKWIKLVWFSSLTILAVFCTFRAFRDTSRNGAVRVLDHDQVEAKVADLGGKATRGHDGPRPIIGITLYQRPLNDTDLAFLGQCFDLEVLDLRETKVSDSTLGLLTNLTALVTLRLDGTNVGDEGLAGL